MKPFLKGACALLLAIPMAFALPQEQQRETSVDEVPTAGASYRLTP